LALLALRDRGAASAANDGTGGLHIQKDVGASRYTVARMTRKPLTSRPQARERSQTMRPHRL